MDIKNLVTVKRIIEEGSFQKAAQVLNYAQSTITFQVRQLEQDLGTQIFERRDNRMVLTEAGRDLLPFINNVLNSVDALQKYSEQRDALQGILTLAAPESIVTYWLQPVLKEFREKAPKVKLRLRTMNCFSIYHLFCNSESDVDVAIHFDVGSYPDRVLVTRLRSFPLTLVGSPDLTERERDFITPNQQKTICNIQNDPDSLSLKILRRYLQQQNISLEESLEVWSIEAIKRSVMSGLGVAFLPRFTLEEELNSGELIEIPTAMEKPQMTAVLVRQKRHWKSPAASLLMDILTKSFPQEMPHTAIA